MTSEKPKTEHRPALDGLRAVAVLLVFGFHVSAPHLSGGFLGVDLFFVLSGYLITSLLLAEAARTGTVAVGTFWSRRVRRLLPAFLVVAVTVAIWGVWKSPGYLREKLRDDLLASLAYVANWRFIGSTSYFANDEIASPLQHVWSLAIEEQFYVVWPLVVLGAIAIAKKLHATPAYVGGRIAFALGAVSAVLLLQKYSPLHLERAYMGTDTRVFEPLAGAILATLFAYDEVRAYCTRLRYPLTILGGVGVALGVARLGGAKEIPAAYFHGGAALFTLACCALIAGIESGKSLFVRGLSLWPLEKLGAISYGVYLWHWPVIVWTASEKAKFSWKKTLLLLGVTLLISAVSYLLVERPVRYGKIGKVLSPRRLLILTPAILFGCMAGAWFSLKMPPKQGFTILLVGDSVPKRLLPYVADEAKKRNWYVYSAAVGGCSTFPSIVTDPDGHAWNQSQTCPAEVGDLQRNLVISQRPDAIIWWSRYDTIDRQLLSGIRIIAGTPEFWEQQQKDLKSEIDWLTSSGAHVFIVEQDRPGLGIQTLCPPQSCSFFVKFIRDRYDLTEKWNQMLRDTAAADPRITVFSIDDVFCHDHNVPCNDTLGSALARPDGSHFSPEGAPIVSAALLDRVAPK